MTWPVIPFQDVKLRYTGVESRGSVAFVGPHSFLPLKLSLTVYFRRVLFYTDCMQEKLDVSLSTVAKPVEREGEGERERERERERFREREMDIYGGQL